MKFRKAKKKRERQYYTEERKKQIAEAYAAGLRTRDIAEKFSTDGSHIAKFAQEYGVPLRKSKRQTSVKTCPNCRCKIDLKGARFCPYCATDIRDEKQILQEKMDKLFTMLVALPQSMRDEAQETIKAVSAYLRK